MPLGLAADQKGILPDRMISGLTKDGAILPAYEFAPDQIQPASLDLRLGDIAYRVRASFLPGRATVATCQITSSAAGNASASSSGRNRDQAAFSRDASRNGTASPARSDASVVTAQVGFTASTKLVSMKVEKSGSRLICFSASMWSA